MDAARQASMPRSAGRQIAAFELSIGRDIGELQQILHAAMQRRRSRADRHDTIILTGSVDSAEEAQRAGDIAQDSCSGPWSFRASSGAPGESGVTGAKFNGMVVNTLTYADAISELRSPSPKSIATSPSNWA